MEAVYVHDLDVIRHDGVLYLVERITTCYNVGSHTQRLVLGLVRGWEVVQTLPSSDYGCFYAPIGI